MTLYDVKTTDLIIPLPVDPATGYGFKRINAGEMTNKGVEAMLNVTPVKTSDFTWDMSWNFTKNNNKLVELQDDLQNSHVGV